MLSSIKLRATWRPAFLVAIVGLLLLLAFATTARAGTVAVSGGVLTWTSSPDHRDVLGVLMEGGQYLISSDSKSGGGVTEAITAGAGCTPDIDFNTIARCDSTGVTSMSFELGDLNDQLTINEGVAIGATVNGGPGQDYINGGPGPDVITGGPDFDGMFGHGGDDTINANDGGLDPDIYCGAGTDTVTSDSADSGARTDGLCENGTLGAPKLSLPKTGPIKKAKARKSGVPVAVAVAAGDEITIDLTLLKDTSNWLGMGNKVLKIGKRKLTATTASSKLVSKVKLNRKGKKAFKKANLPFKVQVGVSVRKPDGTVITGKTTVQIKT